MQPYRLLIVLDAIELTGPGKGVIQFCRYAPEDVEIVVANFAYPDRGTGFRDAAEAAGIACVDLEQASRLDLGPIRSLLRLHQAKPFDIIQSHSFKAHVAAWRAVRQCRLPWLAWVHGWTYQDLRVRLYNAIERRLLMRAGHIAVVTAELRDEFARANRNPGQVSVIRNAVEPARHPRTSFDPDPDAGCRLLCIGRLSHEKGQDLLIDALASLPDEFSLVLVGDGPARESLRERIEAAKLSDRVELAGHVRDVTPFLNTCDFVVLPSRSEGIPNVLLEAMAARVPVISTGVGGVPEVIGDTEAAILAQPSVASLRAALLRGQALDAAGRERIAIRASALLNPAFDPAERARAIVRLHHSLLSETSAQSTG